MKKLTTFVIAVHIGFCHQLSYAETKRYGLGVTDTEIKIGQTMPYSGPASAYSSCGKAHQAFFKSLNQQGGINGRKVNLISLDDAMNPPRTVEQIRRLVEHDGVLLVFSVLGTGSLSIINYLNEKKVPFLFPAAAHKKFHQPKKYPWVMGWVPSFGFEGRMFARYILKHRPNAKIGIIWERDDMGIEEVADFKDELGPKAKQMIVADVSYELTDPTVDSQLISIKGAGADTLISLTSSKFAALTLRKVHNLNWKPLHLTSYGAASVGATLRVAGLDKAIGLITAYFGKDPTNPAVQNDPDVKEFLAWKAKYFNEGDITDGCIPYSYMQAHLLVQVLKQCGNDLSRENIMRQAANLKDVRIPLLLPGITINTSPTDYRPIEEMQFMRFDGERWLITDDRMTEK
jgi:branched-chain amino acid transport system substrate-binding protein